MFEIGTSLREARLRQGLDFPELEQATKIRGKYLRALEDEQFEMLPAQTYVKGFLRNYAEYLGLDGQLYVDEFSSRYVVGEDEAPAQPRRSTVGTRGPRVQSRVVLSTLLGIALVTALVIVAWTRGDPAKQQIAGLGQTVSTTPAVHPRTRRIPFARLLVTASGGSTWIQVHLGTATGPIEYQGTLQLGQSRLFAGRRLWVDVRSPSALTAKLNGKPVRFPAGGSQLFVVTARGGVRVAPGA